MTPEEVIAAQEKEIVTLKESVTKLTKENGDLNVKIQESITAKKKEVTQVKIQESLSQVKDLPKASIEKLKESLKDTVAEEKDIPALMESAIKSERDYLIKLKEGGSTIKGMGESKGNDSVTKDSVEAEIKENRIKLYKKQGMNDVQIKEAEDKLFEESKEQEKK
jgi:hypothetical protein